MNGSDYAVVACACWWMGRSSSQGAATTQEKQEQKRELLPQTPVRYRSEPSLATGSISNFIMAYDYQGNYSKKEKNNAMSSHRSRQQINNTNYWTFLSVKRKQWRDETSKHRKISSLQKQNTTSIRTQPNISRSITLKQRGIRQSLASIGPTTGALIIYNTYLDKILDNAWLKQL